AAAVAIVHRVLQQPPVPVDQAEVDPPRVDGDGIDATRLASDGAKAVEHVLVEPRHVPPQRLALSHGHIREPVDLGDAQTLAVEAADGDAAALGAEVDRGEGRGHLPASTCRTDRRSRGRRSSGSRGPGSAVTTWTPFARQASTSSPGALESVTMPVSSSTGTKERSALRCHFVPSRIP